MLTREKVIEQFCDAQTTSNYLGITQVYKIYWISYASRMLEHGANKSLSFWFFSVYWKHTSNHVVAIKTWTRKIWYFLNGLYWAIKYILNMLSPVRIPCEKMYKHPFSKIVGLAPLGHLFQIVYWYDFALNSIQHMWCDQAEWVTRWPWSKMSFIYIVKRI